MQKYKKTLLGALAVYVAWNVLDFFIHGFILSAHYAASASMWRTPEEAKLGLGYGVVAPVAALCFAGLHRMLAVRNVVRGLVFGLIYGLGVGISRGLEPYAFMPVPPLIAWGWFLGTLVGAVVAGVLVGGIDKSAS